MTLKHQADEMRAHTINEQCEADNVKGLPMAAVSYSWLTFSSTIVIMSTYHVEDIFSTEFFIFSKSAPFTVSPILVKGN